MKLPDGGPVLGSLVAQTADSTTASYKILLMHTILGHLRTGGGQLLSFEEILWGFITTIWTPVAKYRLSLGHADQLASLLHPVPESIRLYETLHKARPFLDVGRSKQKDILRYPIALFLSPWFKAAGAKPGITINVGSTEITAAGAGLYLPYDVNKGGVVLSKAFIDYAVENMAVLQGWTERCLIDYLQQRNPNVPSISRKLRDHSRPPLKSQRLFWTRAMLTTPQECFYTQRSISLDKFDLDHFLPRRFVAHDRIWNLVPTVPDINRQKGVSVPSAHLIPAVAELHFKASRAVLQQPQKRWAFELRQEYMDDLGLSTEALADPQKFATAMTETLQPLQGLARKCFPSWSGPR